MATFPREKQTLCFVLFLCCVIGLRCNGQVLPDDEVQALQAISAKLQLKNFNFSKSFCASGSVNSTIANGILTNFVCKCNVTFCHVTNILLKGQNLTGTLPEEFGDLAFLQEIDLSRNYISGPIPTTFSRIPLTNLSLSGNRINGSIPKEIGDIATLEELILEDNDLKGTLPGNLGNLSRLKRLLLSANDVTGLIPASYGNLNNIMDFRIDGSRISGKIPDLIGNWTKITRLDIQGTFMNGPIPSNISVMKNMTELRILNLNASAIGFPDLSEMKQLRVLILRNCGLTGSVPDYIGGFTQLMTLDLSYNMFTGQIPASFQNLSRISFMSLSKNSLTGPVPSWILENNNYVDISYNNFTKLSSVGCQASSVNLVASSTPTERNSVSWCLKQDLSCSSEPKYSSLAINCGGNKLSFNGTEYEEDKGTEGPSFFDPSAENWAYSSNGVYMGNRVASYKATNTFGLNLTGGDIYKTARIAPNSLRYYGLCMYRGSYTVRLHFAEIMYSADRTFSSIGKRIFDVAIQGNVVLKDFNIAKEAKGVGNSIIKEFKIYVNGSTVDIHLYWTGKGTTAVPDRGVYGPLISAISVTPNFVLPELIKRKSYLAIICICSAVGALLLVLLVWLLFKAIKKRIDRRKKEKHFKQNGGLLLEQQISSRDGNVVKTKIFSSYELEKATDNFNVDRVLGQGGQGTVYKGMLSDGSIVAVKKSTLIDAANVRQFINEVVILSQINHRNIVKLLGCCLETKVPLLVYEFILNGTLFQHIQNPNEDFPLTWETRLRIAAETAGAISYMHSGASLPIYHRDIKSTNILLDEKYKAIVSDFGTSRSVDLDKTHFTTLVQGTFGYLDPEYFRSSQFTEKSDVYSFGVVLVELLTRHKPIFSNTSDEVKGLASHFVELMEQNQLIEIIDPQIMEESKMNQIVAVAQLAKMCLEMNGKRRPTMKEVAVQLEAIRMSPGKNTTDDYYEIENSEIDLAESFDAPSTSTGIRCKRCNRLCKFCSEAYMKY